MKKDDSIWTLEAYIAHNEALTQERDRRYTEVAAEKEKAMTLAKEALNYRLQGMNEFRESMKDQSAHFLTNNEHQLYMARVEEQLKPIIAYVNQQSGGPRAITTSMLISWAGTIVLILAFWFAYGNHMLNSALPVPVPIVQPVK